MQVASYTVNNIRDTGSAGKHVKAIESYLETVGDSLEHIDEYTETLRKSVAESNAYVVTLDNVEVGFIYCHTVGEKLYGAGFWVGSDDIYAAMSLLEAVWKNNKTKRSLRVIPHGDNFKNFLSFASGQSLRAYVAGLKPYIVLPFVDMVDKIIRLDKYLNKG